jgi:hypothetical protein
VQNLVPPSDLPGDAKELLRLWDVSGDPRDVRLAARWPDWSLVQIGEAIASIAADYVHTRELQHRDPEKLKDEGDELRFGFAIALNRAHAIHNPQRYDDWGSPFKTRFTTLGEGTDSVLAKEFSELFARVTDDETAIVYSPSFREFGIPVLDGGPSAIIITHDPFSGKALPKPLRDEWFAAVEKLLGRQYSLYDTGAPDEFQSEAWWIARGL